ncbi:MAG: glycosyltransferase [Geminicoccales bacterium]
MKIDEHSPTSVQKHSTIIQNQSKPSLSNSAGGGGPPIHVLHMINDLDDGGAQTMLCKLLEHRSDERLRYSVVSFLDGGLNRERVLDAGVPLKQLGLSRGKATPAAWLRVVQTLRQNRSSQAQGPCLIQGWLYHANLAAITSRLPIDRKTATLWNIRHSLHDIQQEKALTRSVIRASGLFARLADKVVYCSKVSVQQHIGVGFSKKNVAVIPNGFDCSEFKPSTDAREKLCTDLGIDPKRKIIGMAARYHPMKDHALLLQAAARLQASGQALHLVLIGKNVDPDNEALCRTIADLDLNDHVSLLGYRSDMAALIAGVDVYAMSSKWGEGFPNVLGEAMASGVPCAATDVGDSRWIIGDTGRVVLPGDVEAFAEEALGPLLNLDPAERRRLCEAARARILDNFSIDAVTAQYEDLYLKIGQRLVM